MQGQFPGKAAVQQKIQRARQEDHVVTRCSGYSAGDAYKGSGRAFVKLLKIKARSPDSASMAANNQLFCQPLLVDKVYSRSK